MSRRTPGTIDQEVQRLTAQLSLLQRREDDFTRILEDMVRLQSSIRAERETLDSIITELESQKQPINWLPTELLIEIFLIRTENESADLATGLPYNPAPVTISHVCHKWRELALATSCLWSFISYRTSRWTPQPLSVFLQRAGCSPISFNFISTPGVGVSDSLNMSALEATTIVDIIHILDSQRRRFRSLTFECCFAKSMEYILAGITPGHLHELESLDLAISTLDPSFEGTQLLTSDRLSIDQSPPASPIVLRHLRLQQMPLSILPAFLVRSIHSLELSYPPRKSLWTRLHHFTVKISHLINLLKHTPQLHDLALIGVTPVWDVITRHSTNGQLSSAAEPQDLTVVPPFELPELKRLEWKYAYHRDVFPFMSLITLPQLERWDLFIAQSPFKRFDVTQFRGNHIHDQESFIQAEPLSNVLVLHALKELNVSCQNEDSLGSSLRQFIFPSLTKLDVTFVGRHVVGKESGFPSLPRLESIFRDPRLPHLTHLSISNFDIAPGHGRSMLGYMPNLLTLTLGACTGVDVALDALAEAYGCVPAPGGVRTKACGVRFCPRLEDLVLWSCPDFVFKTLWSTMHTRSFAPEDDDGEEWHKETLETEVFASAVLGREIRPLKKMRNTGPSQQRVEPGGLAVGTSSRSTLIPMQEALHPSRLACLHLEDCPQISHHEALSLGRWGTMVIYR